MFNTLSAGPTLPDQTLTLKKGFRSLLLRSTDLFRGLVGDACFIAEAFQSSLIIIELPTGGNAGKISVLLMMNAIPFTETSPSSDSQEPNCL